MLYLNLYDAVVQYTLYIYQAGIPVRNAITGEQINTIYCT